MDKLITKDGQEIPLKYPFKIKANTEKGEKVYRVDKYSNGGVCLSRDVWEVIKNDREGVVMRHKNAHPFFKKDELE